jgi:hypothetical protein
MWIYALIGASLAGILFTSTGKSVVKIGSVLLNTVKDSIYNKKKDIKFTNINNKNLLVYEDIILLTSKLSRHYDILCFHSNSVNLIKNETIQNYDISLEDKMFIPIVSIKHGSYVSTVPFRPADLDFSHLFIAIKNDIKIYHSVYKFNEKDYINIIDVIHRYEEDLKNSTRKIIFAEAFD